ncbi:MAG: hypothetical protein WKG00_20195 [Polyangiaceae bacterium]
MMTSPVVGAANSRAQRRWRRCVATLANASRAPVSTSAFSTMRSASFSETATAARPTAWLKRTSSSKRA